GGRHERWLAPTPCRGRADGRQGSSLLRWRRVWARGRGGTRVCHGVAEERDARGGLPVVGGGWHLQSGRPAVAAVRGRGGRGAHADGCARGQGVATRMRST